MVEDNEFYRQQDILNKKAKKVFSLPKEERDNYRPILGELCLKMLRASKKIGSYLNVGYDAKGVVGNAVDDFYCSDRQKLVFDNVVFARVLKDSFEHYDPDKGSDFSKYFYSSFTKRMSDAVQERYQNGKGGMVPDKRDKSEAPIDYTYMQNTEERTQEDRINKVADYHDDYNDVIFEETFASVLKNVLAAATMLQLRFYDWFSIRVWLKCRFPQIVSLLNPEKREYVEKNKIVELRDTDIAVIEKVTKGTVSKHKSMYLKKIKQAFRDLRAY